MYTYTGCPKKTHFCVFGYNSTLESARNKIQEIAKVATLPKETFKKMEEIFCFNTHLQTYITLCLQCYVKNNNNVRHKFKIFLKIV